MSGAKWTVGVLALWLAAATFLLGPHAARWNDIATGAVVALAGVWLGTRAAQQGWIVASLGLWLVVAAFVPELRAGSGLHWNNLVVAAAAALAVGIQPRRDGSQSGARSARSAHTLSRPVPLNGG